MMKGVIDHPAENEVLNGNILISGWVSGNDATNIHIEICLDGAPLKIVPLSKVADSTSPLRDNEPFVRFYTQLNTIGFEDGTHTLSCITWNKDEVTLLDSKQVTIQNTQTIFDLHYGSILRLDRILHRDGIYGSGPPVEMPSAEAVRLVKRYAENTILDVGCGHGVYIRTLQQDGYKCEGIEINPSYVAFCQQNNLPVRQMSAHNLDYADNSFDTVIMIEVLEHLPEPVKALEEAFRVARTNVLISVPNISVLPIMSKYQIVPWHLLEATHVNFFTPYNLTATLEQFTNDLEIMQYGLFTPWILEQPLYMHLFAVAYKKRSTMSQNPSIKKIDDHLEQEQQDHTKLIGFIDSPSDSQTVNGLFDISGWVLSNYNENIKLQIRIDDKLAQNQFTSVPRPDVLAAHPEMAANNPLPGFTMLLDTTQYENGEYTLTCIAWNSTTATIISEKKISIHNEPSDYLFEQAYITTDSKTRSEKKDLLQHVLACPVCHSTEPLNFTETTLNCVICGTVFPIREHVPIMISGISPQDMALLVQPTFSSTPYSHNIIEILLRVQQNNGLALDINSGERRFGLPHLIKFDRSLYPLSDLVGRGSILPFKDESFDFVFCLTELEHTPDVWTFASEIQRVTKSGGEILVDAAFLQPIHDHPNHYFNMTISGLHQLFKELEILSLDTAPYQHPYASVQWILQHLLDGLPEKHRQTVKNMSLNQFLEEIHKYMNAAPEQLEKLLLDEHSLRDLAAGFTLHGRKH